MNPHIERVVLREIRLPLKEPFRISSGVVSERRICLLELVDAGGTTGWSECVAGEQPNYSAETIDTAWLALREWLGNPLVVTIVSMVIGFVSVALGCVVSLLTFGLWIGILVVHVMAIIKGINGGRFLIPGVSEYANRF